MTLAGSCAFRRLGKRKSKAARSGVVLATIQAIYRILRMRYANEVAICGMRMMFAYAVIPFSWVVYLSFYYCWQVRSEWRLDLLLVRSLRAGQIGRLSEDLQMHSAFQRRCPSPVCHGAHGSLSLASECTGVAKSFLKSSWFQKLPSILCSFYTFQLHNLCPDVSPLRLLGMEKKIPSPAVSHPYRVHRGHADVR